MHAASRTALQAAEKRLDEVVYGGDVAVAATAGTEFFDVARVLDGERTLRNALSDLASSGDTRARLFYDVFGEKISGPTMEVARVVVASAWSSAKELQKGFVLLGRRALFRAAQKENMLEHVEGELFSLSRLLDHEPKLSQLLTDRNADGQAKKNLLSQVLYGKVAAVTEALACQAVAQGSTDIVADIADLASAAASIQGKTVARVTSAAPLTDAQVGALTEKLGRIYGQEMIIHQEVDPSLLGGVVIRVGDEIIDGSTAHKIEVLKATIAS